MPEQLNSKLDRHLHPPCSCRHQLSGGDRLSLSVLRQADNLRRVPGLQCVSYQAALLGAHTAGVGVYHVRQKDKPDSSHAVHKLQELYHEAKLEPPDISDAHHMELVRRARSVAKVYVGLDDRFSILLGNAVPNLFTFIRYLDMDPTNNESERMLRKVAIHRKIHQKIITVGGKIMFGTIMTCLLTWDKRGLNWFEKLSEAFWGT